MSFGNVFIIRSWILVVLRQLSSTFVFITIELKSLIHNYDYDKDYQDSNDNYEDNKVSNARQETEIGFLFWTAVNSIQMQAIF